MRWTWRRETCLFLIPRAGQVHNPRVQQTGSICSSEQQQNYSLFIILCWQDKHLEVWKTVSTTVNNKQHIFNARTKVVSGGVEVLLGRGAGEGQSSAQAAVVHHHVEEDVWTHHLHHRVQRPNCQVGTVLQRLPRPDNNTCTWWEVASQ